jgi:hypothetical protein
MKENEFLKWKAALPQLTPEQVTQVLTSLKSLGKIGAVTLDNSAMGVEDDWLFQGIVMALRKHGLASASGLVGLRRSKAFKQYYVASIDMRKQLAKLIPDGNNKSQARQSLAYLVGVCLIDWCKKRRVVPTKKGFKDIPVSAQYILSQTSHILEALDDQFPGYRAANMFHLVVGRKK